MSKKSNNKDVTNKILITCIILAAIAGVYCVVTDLIQTGQNIVDANPLAQVVSKNEDAIEIFTEMKDLVTENVDKIIPNGFTSSNIEQVDVQNTFDDTGTLVRVVDGDTYVIAINGTDTKVRLIGVDTPESVAPENYYKENTESGAKVSDIVKERIKTGDTLYLNYDVEKTDKYGRTLAYVYFDNSKMVQDWLLSNGYAQVMTVQPNSKYAAHFAELEQAAMESQVGLWNGIFNME